MYLHALATANPILSLTQAECWNIARESAAVRDGLTRRSQLILRTILRGDSGVASRQFGVSEIERIFDLDTDELNAEFRRAAPELAHAALAPALAQAGLAPTDLDALVICTCTGYLCPGVTSYVAEQLGLRPDAYLQDLAGLGCGAAIPALRSVDGILARNPDAVVACVAVEVCSAAFYLDDDPGVIISACLFGDGAAATIWRGQPGPTGLRCHGFDTLHDPANRDQIRFEHRNGKLRNLLTSTVPELAAHAVADLHARTVASAPSARPITRIVPHSGGKDVIDAVAAKFPDHDLTPTREILRRHGNMSSPSVLFALEEALKTDVPTDTTDWWLVAFGAGFSAHSCRLGV
ncbi:3-oxoacyl-[acyl-carrier-protein] synthase III C-terminal domain-containing protein [Synoicihabitans lomoniglobus]|uniref:3-oxoacyl-[acyl-carrier-protein] synthase III C-terminal domain-containing protein n=1 Tax=Synoicihabitans lomoniglobus TaxID=2909285 RepID=A0AAF0CPF5_9BACT|nr:stilbene synthase [Opitutaceae bacterium LMO-M01]WED64474.1 3-oxoacyl-[acyl-carrier-protein] synthase III C-terminal domain-containing protein [Opitutaceae bacterium LMO-M01]